MGKTNSFPLPHCIEDILPSSKAKNFSWLALLAMQSRLFLSFSPLFDLQTYSRIPFNFKAHVERRALSAFFQNTVSDSIRSTGWFSRVRKTSHKQRRGENRTGDVQTQCASASAIARFALPEKRLKNTCGAPSAVRRTSRPLFIDLWLRRSAPHAAIGALASGSDPNSTAWADVLGPAPLPLAHRKGTNLRAPLRTGDVGHERSGSI